MIIALMGLPGAGKDSVADAIHRSGLVEMHRVAFADKLRSEVCLAWDVRIRMFIDREAKEKPVEKLALRHCRNAAFNAYRQKQVAAGLGSHGLIDVTDADKPRSPRDLLKIWGTWFRRATDDQYWSNVVRRRLEDSTYKRASYEREGNHTLRVDVVTDFRHYPEYVMLKCQIPPVHFWLVERPNTIASNTSELFWKDVIPDLVIRNEGTLEDLQKQVQDALSITHPRLNHSNTHQLGIGLPGS